MKIINDEGQEFEVKDISILGDGETLIFQLTESWEKEKVYAFQDYLRTMSGGKNIIILPRTVNIIGKV